MGKRPPPSTTAIRITGISPNYLAHAHRVAEGKEDVHGPAGRMAAWDGGGNVSLRLVRRATWVESRREPRLCQSDFWSRNWTFRRVGSAREGLPPGAAGWDAPHPWRESLADPTPGPTAARGTSPDPDAVTPSPRGTGPLSTPARFAERACDWPLPGGNRRRTHSPSPLMI